MASVGMKMSTIPESPFSGNSGKGSFKQVQKNVEKETQSSAQGGLKGSKSFALSDQDLVDEAMNHVPSMAAPVLKKPVAKLKRPAASDSKTHEDEPKMMKRPASMETDHEGDSASAPRAVSSSNILQTFCNPHDPTCI